MLPQWPDSFNGSYILPDTLRARCRYEREVATVQAGVSEIECLVYCDLLRYPIKKLFYYVHSNIIENKKCYFNIIKYKQNITCQRKIFNRSYNFPHCRRY